MDDPNLCFGCNNLLFGKTCQIHHAKMCCALPPVIRKWYRPMEENKHKQAYLFWIDCNICDLQVKYRKTHRRSAFALSKWARLTIRHILRTICQANLRQLAATAFLDSHLKEHVLGYAA